jgi:hypothetical protein
VTSVSVKVFGSNVGRAVVLSEIVIPRKWRLQHHREGRSAELWLARKVGLREPTYFGIAAVSVADTRSPFRA